MFYLAIESSCDETSMAILETKNKPTRESFYEYLNSFKVLGSVISSQIKVHRKYGGVVPEIGAREHSKNIHLVFEQLLKQVYPELDIEDRLGNFYKELDGIFVTAEPGLKSALRVGVEFAKTVQYFTAKKSDTKPFLRKVNHLQGHLFSCFWNPENNIKYSDDQIFPHLHLLVSGGNSQILFLNKALETEIFATTLDDAAGECLDKIGRMLGLPYPGGVWLSKIAGETDQNPLNFSIGMSKNDKIAYSFSGLKTSVRMFLEKQIIDDFIIEKPLDDLEIEDLLTENLSNTKLRLIKSICISTQFVVMKQLINKFKQAVREYAPSSIGLSGGVSANKILRQKISQIGQIGDKDVFIPLQELTGDNATMIGLAGLKADY